MTVTRNLAHADALIRRRRGRHRAVLASGALTVVIFLSSGCHGAQVHVKHIHRAPTGASGHDWAAAR